MPIVVVDVAPQARIQLLDIVEIGEMEIFGFQGSEKALHSCIVKAIPLSRHTESTKVY